VAGAPLVLLCVLVVGGLALIGGLAAACFTKAFGCVFLGEPRSAEAARGHEVGSAMRVAMVTLAGACCVVALAAPLWPRVYDGAVVRLLPAELAISLDGRAHAQLVLSVVCAAFWALLALVALLAWARGRMLRAGQVDRGPTWDCGYAAPTARMQYTAS